MVYLTSDQYEQAYKRLLDGAAEASKAGTGACSVLVLVANDPDAICAARILFNMLKHDFVAYKMVPVSSYLDISRCNQQLVETNPELRTIILINCGATVDLQETIKMHDKLTTIIIDNHRPYNLYNIFWNEQILCLDDGDLDQLQELQESFNFLEFGGADSSDEEHDSESSNQDSDASEYSESDPTRSPTRKHKKLKKSDDYDASTAFIKAQEKRAIRREKRDKSRAKIAQYYSQGSYYGQSSAICCFQIADQLGRPVLIDTAWWAILGATSQICLDQIDSEGYMLIVDTMKDTVSQLIPPHHHLATDSQNYISSTSTSSRNAKNRNRSHRPNDASSRANTTNISNAAADGRSLTASTVDNGLNLNLNSNQSGLDSNSTNFDLGLDFDSGSDNETSSNLIGLMKNSKSVQPRIGIFPSNEFKFFMVRHWSLESSMAYSSFVATRLGTWSSRGKSLFGLMVAKLGLARTEIRQNYSHLDPKLKAELPERWDRIAADYNLEGATYTSFIRAFGWRFPVASASDHVWALIALLSAESAARDSIHMRDGEISAPSSNFFNSLQPKGQNQNHSNNNNRNSENKYQNDNQSNIENGNGNSSASLGDDLAASSRNEADLLESHSKSFENWKDGFFLAYDALSDTKTLQTGLALAMKMQAATVEMGSLMLERRAVKTLSKFRLAVINNDCADEFVPFLHSPLVLIQLAHFLIDALRHHGRSEHQSLPFILAVLDPAARSYLVLGIAPPEYLTKLLLQQQGLHNNHGGDVAYSTTYSGEARNRFGLIFEQAASDSAAKILNSYFDASTVLILERNLASFIDKLRKHM